MLNKTFGSLPGQESKESRAAKYLPDPKCVLAFEKPKSFMKMLLTTRFVQIRNIIQMNNTRKKNLWNVAVVLLFMIDLYRHIPHMDRYVAEEPTLNKVTHKAHTQNIGSATFKYQNNVKHVNVIQIYLSNIPEIQGTQGSRLLSPHFSQKNKIKILLFLWPYQSIFAPPPLPSSHYSLFLTLSSTYYSLSLSLSPLSSSPLLSVQPYSTLFIAQLTYWICLMKTDLTAAPQ